MSTPTWSARRWAGRLLAHRCGRCGRDLPAGYPRTSCLLCLEKVAEGVRKAYWRRRGLVPPDRGHRPTVGARRLAAEFARRA